jgi:hypothetical protein
MERFLTHEELIDNAPGYAEGVSSLWSWSGNYDYPSPASLFLDLIGYSDEHFGEALCDLTKMSPRLGYLELDLLADALKEYADRPGDVMEYVELLLQTEDA